MISVQVRPVGHSRRSRFARRTGLTAGAVVLAASCAAAGSSALSRPATSTTVRDVAVSVDPDQGADAGISPSPLGPPLSAPTPIVPTKPAPVARPVAQRPSAVTVGAWLPMTTGSTQGVPTTVLAAYRHAVAVLDAGQPGCHIPLALLAGIGKVESGHAEGGRVDANGTALQPILGPVLDGTGGTAAIADTDHGLLDGNTTWDRAVGPMQFIPSTWRNWASDGNGDGIADPENVYDASLGAARYLCADNRDLATPSGLDAAILSYNDSASYLTLVGMWMAVYGSNIVAVTDTTGPYLAPPPAPAEAVAAPAPVQGRPASTGTPAGPVAAAPAAPVPAVTVPARSEPADPVSAAPVPLVVTPVVEAPTTPATPLPLGSAPLTTPSTPPPSASDPCSTATAMDGVAQLLLRLLPGQPDRREQLLQALRNRSNPGCPSTYVPIPSATTDRISQDPLWTVCLQQLGKLGEGGH